jgi:hypothetical protein
MDFCFALLALIIARKQIHAQIAEPPYDIQRQTAFLQERQERREKRG